EGEHPPDLRGDPGDLHLRQHVHHPQHRDQRHHARRRLLGLPPLLHRQAEDPRHRWPRRPLREAVRQEGL
ncbi:MAG: LSU ribosomal protein L31p @ LSU ribosomal protein L31p, zinc-dependent, partial [uncultured Friedmanniella sp.]